jgi:hypothetical protein
LHHKPAVPTRDERTTRPNVLTRREPGAARHRDPRPHRPVAARRAAEHHRFRARCFRQLRVEPASTSEVRFRG